MNALLYNNALLRKRIMVCSYANRLTADWLDYGRTIGPLYSVIIINRPLYSIFQPEHYNTFIMRIYCILLK